MANEFCTCGHLNRYHIIYETPQELLAHVVRIKANNCKIVRDKSRRITGYKFFDGVFYRRSQALMTAMWNIDQGIECVKEPCECKGYRRDNLKYLERLSYAK